MNPGLTTFRAFALFAIFLFHTGKLGAGYLGVQAFFVLSGFLLTPILVEMKSSLDTRDFSLHFYGRRALRIFPLYYFYLTVVGLALYIGVSQGGYSVTGEIDRFLKQLPWAATYTYNFYHATKYYQESYFVSHFWSLAVEEQFYLVWPLAILCIPGKHLKSFLAFLFVIGPLLRLLLALISFNHIVPILHGRTDLVIFVLPSSYMDAFAIGGFFSLYGKGRSGLAVWLCILLVLATGLITSWLSTGDVHWFDLGYGRFMKDSYKYVWGYLIMNLLFAYILVNVRDRKFMTAIFENALLNYLGKISYGMYVFHYPIIWVIYSAFNKAPEYFRISMALAVTIIVSMISFELMEKRFINLKDKYFARTSSANKQLGT